MDSDIQENRLLSQDSKLLSILLQDKTTGHNLIWGTDTYANRGEGYNEHDEITIEAITGINGSVIVPRMHKLKIDQEARVHDKGEVFTPAWVVNEQNNLIDSAWFGHRVIFNYEKEKGWKATYRKVIFSKTLGKTWQDYVNACRMEVTCGEAPYLTSRYDVVSSQTIPVKMRVGILDRKLRIVTENVSSPEEWLVWASKALQSIYGYDWQGDNVLLARENVLCAVAEAYQNRFHSEMPLEYWQSYADIVAWNIWQMDGLKYVVPDSCHPTLDYSTYSFVDEMEQKPIPTNPCPGCRDGDIRKHNGSYCMIMDWKENKPVCFIDTIGGND